MNLFTNGVPNHVTITEPDGSTRETVIIPINVMYDSKSSSFLMKAVDRDSGNIIELDFNTFEPTTKW